MNDIVATTSGGTGPVHFLNIEYFFRVIYEMVFHRGVDTVNFGSLGAEIWLTITVAAYVLSLGFLALLAYTTIRLKQLQEEEHHHYDTITEAKAENVLEHDRWKHVQELIESPQESDWRQAIIEADIILDDLLAHAGYVGASVGEKLKQADPVRFRTLQEAWEAHKVRNDIAHKGSAFPLPGNIAYRTIGHYQNVFQEFNLI